MFFFIKDIYWNAPVVWNNTKGEVLNLDDKQSFLNLVTELREAFTKDDLLLSVDISGLKKTIKKAYNLKKLSKQVLRLKTLVNS